MRLYPLAALLIAPMASGVPMPDRVLQYQQPVPVNTPACVDGAPGVKFLSPSSVQADWDELLKTNYNVFCVLPGEYKTVKVGNGPSGSIKIENVGGTAAKKRYLVYTGGAYRQAIKQPMNMRARMNSLSLVNSPYWVIRGITFYGRPGGTWPSNVHVENSHHVVLADSLVEGAAANLIPAGEGWSYATNLVNIVDSDYFLLQRNVIRKTRAVPNSDRICVNYLTSRYGVIAHNEISDCTSNQIQLGSGHLTEGWHEGTTVAYNTVYLSGATYCDGQVITGNDDGFSASETGIDSKGSTQKAKTEPMSEAERTYIAGNLFYGLRRTKNVCGATGTGSPVFLIYADWHTRAIDIINNVSYNTSNGSSIDGAWTSSSDPNFKLFGTRDIKLRGNLFVNLKDPPDNHIGYALGLDGSVAEVEFTDNIVVNAQHPLLVTTGGGDGGNKVECNTFVSSGASNVSLNSAPRTLVRRNAFYATPVAGLGDNQENIVSPDITQSGLVAQCFFDRPLTQPGHQLCLPYAALAPTAPRPNGCN